MFKHNGPHRAWFCRVAVCVIICLGISGVLISLSGPVRAQGVELTKLARTSTGNISARLPDTWTFQDTSGDAFDSAVLIVGDSPTALQGILGFATGQPPAVFNGLGGLIGIYKAGGVSPETFLTTQVQALIESIQTSDIKVLEQGNYSTQAGGIGVMMQVIDPQSDTQGYVGILNYNRSTAFIDIFGTTANFAENKQLLLAILQSIHIPGEEGLTSRGGAEATPTLAGFSFPTLPPEGGETTPTPPPEVTPGGAEATPTLAGFGFPTLPPEGSPEAPASTPVSGGKSAVVRSAGGEVSIDLPAGWVSSDLVASDKILAFGDMQASMQSRVDTFRSGAGQASGNGGLILLLSAADLQVQPPIDAESLLSQELTSASYQVVEQLQKLDVAVGSGAYAVVASGGQEGYVALIAFGDKAALVSATGTPDTFAANRDLLLAVVKSIHMPAVKGGISLPSLLGGAGPTATPQ